MKAFYKFLAVVALALSICCVNNGAWAATDWFDVQEKAQSDSVEYDSFLDWKKQVENGIDASGTADLGDLKSDIAQNKSDIETNKSNIANNRTDIDRNTSNIAKNSTNIEQNRQDVAKANVRISENTRNIAQNRADINTNAAGIADNRNRINGLEDRVGRMESKIDELDDRINDVGAMGMAASSLRFPLDGRDKKFALAVGAGAPPSVVKQALAQDLPSASNSKNSCFN